MLIGLLLSAVPLIRWMPGLLIDGNEVEIRTFLERSLDIVIGIEFIKMLAKHSPGSSLEVLLYAIARHLVVGHDSALENLLSVGAIALIFIVRKYFFVPAFGAHLPDGHLAPDLSPAQSGIHWLHPEPETEPGEGRRITLQRKTGGAAQHCVQAPPVSLFDFTVCRGGQSGIPCRRGCAGCWSGAYR